MIKRGSIYTIAAKGAYTGKPRPAVILQNPSIEIDSIIILPITTTDSAAPDLRIEILPSEENGLAEISYVMCDKIVAIPVTNLGRKLGEVTAREILEIDEAVQFILSDVLD